MVANPLEIDEREQYESSLTYLHERIAELEFAQEDVGWLRLGGEYAYEFSKHGLRQIISRSRLFYLSNPLIRRSCNLQADYIFAQGCQVQGTSKLVNQVIQEFLDDPQNKKEFTSASARLEAERTLLIDGNVFFVLFTDKIKTGKVQIRSIIVDEIVDIITNPDDASEVWYYKREWTPVDEDGLIVGEQKIAYYPDINYMPKTNAKLPRTRKGFPVYWDAPIIHIKTGALKKSKFGVPETYPALSWARAHSKMLEDWATIIATFARFAFDLKVPGGKQSVQAARTRLATTVGTGSIAETNPAPTTGSMFIRNKDGAELSPIRTSGATTSAEDSRQLRLQVAAAMGLPDPMLSGEVDVGNLATAKTLDRPTELKFRSRQKLWEDVILQVVDWLIRWSIESSNGLLSAYVKVGFDSRGNKEYTPKNDPDTKKPIDLHVEVVFPPILERTVQERIDAIIGAVTLNGKSFAFDSPELKKLTIRLMLQALGLNDVDELTDLIFNSLTDDDLSDSDNDPDPDPNIDSGANKNEQPEQEEQAIGITS